MLRQARSRWRSSRLAPHEAVVARTVARKCFQIGFLAARKNFGINNIFDERHRIILVERVLVHSRVCARHSTAVLVRGLMWGSQIRWKVRGSGAFCEALRCQRFVGILQARADASNSGSYSSSSLRRCRALFAHFDERGE